MAVLEQMMFTSMPDTNTPIGLQLDVHLINVAQLPKWVCRGTCSGIGDGRGIEDGSGKGDGCG